MKSVWIECNKGKKAEVIVIEMKNIQFNLQKLQFSKIWGYYKQQTDVYLALYQLDI